MFTIPNIITLANLLCGVLGIYAVINGNAQSAFWYVVVSVAFDYGDGLAARLLKVSSPMGKELDSLADMVSFGVLPGVVLHAMITELGAPYYLAWAGYCVIAFSALRLAKFNIDERQSDTFIGLPTPSNTLFFASLPFVSLSWVKEPWLLVGLGLLFSYFLVSEIRMFALKFKDFGLAKNLWKYLAIVFALSIVLILGIEGIPLVILSYIIFSVVRGFTSKQ